MVSVPVTREFDSALRALRESYAHAHPESAARFRKAASVLPGSNTRSVLHFQPFPLYMKSGRGAEVCDVDDLAYVDFVGEFSAGLFGHSDPAISAAIRSAIDNGIVLAAPTDLEFELASLITGRIPSIERIRFCNSGTEANILAIMTSIALTGRRKVLVFNGAYHGGVLTFPPGGNKLNLPLDFVFADYNDIVQCEELIRTYRDDLAAVIVEPILGAAGNIPATPQFMAALRRTTSEAGTFLIFDEVKTSRCGASGMQGRLGVQPDMTTLGKYIGGGLACGAFGGRADIMSRFDPQLEGGLKHAGTFNNNVCAMAAGIAGLSKVFTPERADEFLISSENFREQLNSDCAARGAALQFSGLGSLFTLHFTDRTIFCPSDIPAESKALAQLFHLFCLMNGVLVASRGDIFMSLPMTQFHREKLRHALSNFIDRHGPLATEIQKAANA